LNSLTVNLQSSHKNPQKKSQWTNLKANVNITNKMKHRFSIYFLLAISFLSICSSWLSVKPSTEYRYNKLLTRAQNNPNSVTDSEWIENEMDGGMTALSLIVIGIISYVISTITAFLIMLGLDVKKFTTVGYVLSATWLLLACALHGYVWL